MRNSTRKFSNRSNPWASIFSFLLAGALLACAASARADEADARRLLQAMSDYMAAQQAIAFEFDATLQIVTTENQKLGLASSGTVRIERPDKLRVTRHGGFANAELVFDGRTLTLLGKNANVFGRLEIAGSIDDLIDTLRDEYQRPLPAADLLMSNVHDQLMAEVIDVKDLGSGVIRGVECDHLAFRTEEVDWEIWIAQGDRPYPCRYVITSPQVAGGPQYAIDVREWQTGSEVASDDFSLAIPADAKELEPGDLPQLDALPEIFELKIGAE